MSQPGQPELSTVLNLTLAEVEEHLGGANQLQSMDMEEILKQLASCPTMETLPSFMRTTSWQNQLQQHLQQPVGGEQQPAGAAAAPDPAAAQAVEAQAQAHAQARAQEQAQAEAQAQATQHAAAAAWNAAGAAAAQAQARGGGGAEPTSLQAQLQAQEGPIVPLASVRMEQIFSWFAENQAAAQKPQVPTPSMTLSQLFDAAGLHLAPSNGQVPAGSLLVEVQQVQAPPGGLAGLNGPASLAPPHASLAPPHVSAAPPQLAMHPHVSLLPAGLSPAGPFAGSSISLAPMGAPQHGPSSLNPPSLAPASLGPASLNPPSLNPPSLNPPSLNPPSLGPASLNPPAAAKPGAGARAPRSRKRKDPGTPGPEGTGAKAAAGPLSAAEAARQAKLVAERAAAELAELPDDLDDADTRAIKRALKNRESAARSRAKRQEYTATLEQQVEDLKKQNLDLRHTIVTTVAAPPDPHALVVDGELMQRSRTGPF